MLVDAKGTYDNITVVLTNNYNLFRQEYQATFKNNF